jgi:hypothetical protein
VNIVMLWWIYVMKCLQKTSKILLTLKSDDLNATYKCISYDPGEWNFPIQDIDRVNYILKGSIRGKNVTFPMDANNRCFSSFH